MTTELIAPMTVDLDCPIRQLRGVLNGKWSGLVLTLIHERGPVRPAEVLEMIPALRHKVLTDTLRTLERHGFIAREEVGTWPKHVEYSLSELGESLCVLLTDMKAWTQVNIPRIEAAQQKYDASTKRCGRHAPGLG